MFLILFFWLLNKKQKQNNIETITFFLLPFKLIMSAPNNETVHPRTEETSKVHHRRIHTKSPNTEEPSQQLPKPTFHPLKPSQKLQHRDVVFNINKKADPKVCPNELTNFIEKHKRYNIGSPYELHRRSIYKRFFKTETPSTFSAFFPKFFVPPIVSPFTSVSGNMRKTFDFLLKEREIKVEGNRMTVVVHHEQRESKVITVVFCDENNYNILRIGDEVHKKESEKESTSENKNGPSANINFLVNCDYVYPGGGVHEREMGEFASRVKGNGDPPIERVCASKTNCRSDEMDSFWSIHADEICKKLNKVCVSSEENFSFYSNFLDVVKYLLMDDGFVVARTPEKMKFEEYKEIPRVSERPIFCGRENFGEVSNVIERYPFLWASEISRHFAEQHLLFIKDLGIFTNYEYQLLENPWKANAICGVGPLFVEDYDDPKQVDSFMDDYKKLAENIVASSPGEKGNNEEEKHILILSTIGGRFQVQRKFENLEQHSDELTKYLIEMSRNNYFTKGFPRDMSFSRQREMQLVAQSIILSFGFRNDIEDKEKTTLEELEKLMKKKIELESDAFSENMRRNRMIKCFIDTIINNDLDIPYDEIFFSVPTGEYEFVKGKKLVVKEFDGPYGPGSAFAAETN